MRFDWDEAKNRVNGSKHKVSFETAKRVFDDPRALSIKDRVVETEERWQTMGLVGGCVVLLVAHTVHEKEGEEVIRIISARRATPRERKIYEDSRQERS